MTDYNIVFTGGKEMKLKGCGCFSDLNALKAAISFRRQLCNKDITASSDPKVIDRDIVKKVTYHMNFRMNLSDKDVNTYLEYLYYHRGWGKYVLNSNVTSIRKYGVSITADIHGEQLLAVLTAFRYIDEYPRIVKSFCTFIGEKYKLHPDVAFMAAHLIKVGSGTYSDPYCLDSHALLEGHLTYDDLVGYINDFPFDPISKMKYNDTHKTQGVNEWFNQYNEEESLHTLKESFQNYSKDKVEEFLKRLQQSREVK